MKMTVSAMIAVGALTLTFGIASAPAQQPFPATLAGHAFLPAKTFIAPPKDAPESLRTSGKYTAPDGRREDRLGAIAGTSYLSDRSAPRPTGVSLPFKGQPVQGFRASRRCRTAASGCCPTTATAARPTARMRC